MWVVVSIAKESDYCTAEVYADRGDAQTALLEFKDEETRDGTLLDFWLDHRGGGCVETRSETVYLVEAAMGGLSHGGSSESRGVTGSEGVTGPKGVSAMGEGVQYGRVSKDDVWDEVRARFVNRRSTVDLYKANRSSQEWFSLVALAVEFYDSHREGLISGGINESDLLAGFGEEWIPMEPDDRARFFDHLGLSWNVEIADLVAHGSIVNGAQNSGLDGVITEFLMTAADAVMRCVLKTARGSRLARA